MTEKWQKNDKIIISRILSLWLTKFFLSFRVMLAFLVIQHPQQLEKGFWAHWDTILPNP